MKMDLRLHSFRFLAAGAIVALGVAFIPDSASAQAMAPDVGPAPAPGPDGSYGSYGPPDNGAAYAPGPSSGDSDWVAYCSAKYRSFDPSTGTFMGYDGIRHECR
jgi:hypothetical protein